MAMPLQSDATREPPARSSSAAGPDPTRRTLYRAGSLATIAFILLTIVSIAVTALTRYPTAQAGMLPDASTTLAYVQDNRTAFVIDQILIQVPFLLTAVTFMALYVALKHLDGTSAAIGLGLAIGSMIASLIYLTIAFALVQLSDQAAVAATESQRAASAGAAVALVALYNAPSLATLLWPAAIVAMSIPMLRGVFHRTVAYLGVLTGAAGIVAEAARPIVGGAYSVYGVLLLAWIVAVTWKLYQLGRAPVSSRGPGA